MEKLKLQNKLTGIELTATDKAKYSDLCSITLDVMPQGGFDVSTMKSRLDVRAALDSANGNIELSQMQYDTLKQCVNEYRWARIDEEIVSFVDDVNNLK